MKVNLIFYNSIMAKITLSIHYMDTDFFIYSRMPKTVSNIVDLINMRKKLKLKLILIFF